MGGGAEGEGGGLAKKENGGERQISAAASAAAATRRACFAGTFLFCGYKTFALKKEGRIYAKARASRAASAVHLCAAQRRRACIGERRGKIESWRWRISALAAAFCKIAPL